MAWWENDPLEDEAAPAAAEAWWSADPVALPEGVKPSTAGAGRGVVNPPLAEPEQPGLLSRMATAVQRGFTSTMRGGDAQEMAEAAEILNVIDAIEAGRFQDDAELANATPYASLFAGAGRSPEALASLRATMQKRLAGNAVDFAGRSERLKGMEPTGALKRFQEAQGWGESVRALADAPVDVAGEITAESLGALGPSLPAIAIGGVAGGVRGLMGATGVTSGTTEYLNELPDIFRKLGVDMSDERAVRAAIDTPEFQELSNQALIKSGVIGAFDGATAGVMGTRLAKGAVKNLAAQTGVQMAGGAGGEVAGSVASGQEVRPSAVLGEMIGEGPTAVVDAATLGAKNAMDRRAGTSPSAAAPAPVVRLEDMPTTPLTPEQLESIVPRRVEPTLEVSSPSSEPGSKQPIPAAPAPAAAVEAVTNIERILGGVLPQAAREENANVVTDVAVPAEVPAGPADGRDAELLGSSGDVGLLPADPAGREQGVAPAPAPGGRAAVPAGAEGVADTPLMPEAPAVDRTQEILAELERVRTRAPAPEEIEAAANEAATSPLNDLPEPTEAQKQAGNYKVGRITWNGLPLSIENPKGSTRSGTDPNGQRWEVRLPAHYGYVRRTEGADGDHVDIYVGDKPESTQAFVVDQVDADTGKFDEHKVIVGVDSQAEAQALYDAGFSDGRGPQRRGAITPMGVDALKTWLREGDTTKPLGRLAPRKRAEAAKPDRSAQILADLAAMREGRAAEQAPSASPSSDPVSPTATSSAAPAPAAAARAPETQQLIDLRKRLSVLQSLKGCLS